MKSARTAGAPLRARTPGRRRWSPRLAIAGLLALALVALGGVAAFGVIVGTPNRGHMAAVGPVSSDNGFPAWYKDDTGVRVQPCLDDPKCAAVAGPPSALPDPSQPISFPDNFPDEFFYMLAASDFNIAGGGRAVTNLALEGAFTTNVADGQQMVFDRVRFFFGGLKAGAAYTITHPYGVDKIVAEQDPGAAAGVGRIRYTEDVGAGAGTFAQALNGRIGPFLKSTAAPAGYLGDGATAGPVTGSPYDTNFIRIEGPGVGAGVPAANQCPTPSADCIQSAAFTVEGKLATNGGVGVDRVTYSRKAGDTGGMVDVLATSDDATTQALQVTGSGFDPTLLEGEKGHYEARVGFTGAPPANVTVTNTGDVPVASKTVAVTDAITATAVYDTDKDTLTINASSSDQATSPTLTAAGFGDIPASGSLVVPNAAGAPA